MEKGELWNCWWETVVVKLSGGRSGFGGEFEESTDEIER